MNGLLYLVKGCIGCSLKLVITFRGWYILIGLLELVGFGIIHAIGFFIFFLMTGLIIMMIVVVINLCFLRCIYLIVVDVNVRLLQ